MHIRKLIAVTALSLLTSNALAETLECEDSPGTYYTNRWRSCPDTQIHRTKQEAQRQADCHNEEPETEITRWIISGDTREFNRYVNKTPIFAIASASKNIWLGTFEVVDKYECIQKPEPYFHKEPAPSYSYWKTPRIVKCRAEKSGASFKYSNPYTQANTKFVDRAGRRLPFDDKAVHWGWEPMKDYLKNRQTYCNRGKRGFAATVSLSFYIIKDLNSSTFLKNRTVLQREISYKYKLVKPQQYAF